MAIRFRMLSRAAAVILAAGLGLSPVGAQPIQHVMVLDGDTIEIDGRIIHLYGIDAPELGQHCLRGGILTNCGLSAAFELQKFVSMQITPVDCVPRKEYPEGDVQVCTVGHENIAKVMLRNGSVMAVPDSDPDYLEAERYAKVAGLGIWHTSVVPPWAWRAGRRLPEESTDDKRPCPIKGVVDKNGQRIFYVVTDAAYWRRHIDSARGERYFCSLEAAWKAGWRHATERKDKERP